MLKLENGKIDILASLLLFSASLLLFYSGSSRLAKSLSSYYVETSITTGQQDFFFLEEDKKIGFLSLTVYNQQNISIEGQGQIKLLDYLANIQLSAETNMLGQLRFAEIKVATEDQLLFHAKAEGIYPVRIKINTNNQFTSWASSDEPVVLQFTPSLQTKLKDNLYITNNRLLSSFIGSVKPLKISIEESKQSMPFSIVSSNLTFNKLMNSFNQNFKKDKIQ